MDLLIGLICGFGVGLVAATWVCTANRRAWR